MAFAWQETAPLLVRRELRPVVPPPVTRLQYLASSVIATLHLVRGVALMTSPAFVLAGFGFALLPGRPGAAVFLTTLLGLRDVLLGGLLAKADARRGYEVQRALGIALFSDSIDTFVLIFVVACSWSRRNPVPEIVSVALLAVLEHLTLWSFGDDEYDEDDEDEDEDEDENDQDNNNLYARGAQHARPKTRPSYQAIVQMDRLHDQRRRLGMWLEDLKRAEEAEAEEAEEAAEAQTEVEAENQMAVERDSRVSFLTQTV
ncbi:hypothetical protein E4U43_006636 [Claviceps pusilla]|uniref:Uncharacterized protein n=1 Tax=Claviceps pusilla TaxID=123648 RepID=A0A9P7SVH9_9HYPO|nr:hypothetical protein E4U43_006636 [Claviceps pusilla]